MDSIESILAQAENPAFARTVTARVLLRQDLVAAHAQLEADLAAAIPEDARENRIPVAPRLAEDLEALEAEIVAAKVEFVFRAIGKRAWANLLAKHPPTKDQLRVERQLDHNPETFPIAAIAASCISPAVTVDDVARLERALNASQFDVLWAKCVDANVGGVADPKSVAAGLIRRANGLSASSATAAAEPSLAASSSDE